MAMYHFSISNVSRANGSSSCASLAYITGETVTDERTGRTYDYARKERVLTTGTVLPESAPPEYADPKNLFNAVEQNEAALNARTAKKIELALPHELTLDRQIKLLESFIRTNLTSRGYCVAYAIHDQTDGNKNFHAHLLIANRPLDQNGRWVKERYKTAIKLDDDGKRVPLLAKADDEVKVPLVDDDGHQITDENGTPLFQKCRARKGKGIERLWQREKILENPLDTKSFLKAMRKSWADEINRCPEIILPVDHRSHADRGLETAPTKHEGQFARTLERRGVIDRVCQYNREVRAANNELEADLADIRDRIQTAKNAGHGIGGKIGNMASSAAGAVKSAGKTAKSTLDNLTGGRPDERSRGFIGAVADTVNDGVSSAINKSPIGVVSAPFKMPLNVMKNVDCTEVEQMKAAEADKKSKKRKKGNANDNDKKSPGISRSRGR